jgi:DNA modification methylase
MTLTPNLLILDDSLRVLERIESQSVDVVYLDPPWFTENGFIYEGKSFDDYLENIYKVLQQSFRVLKDSGCVVLFSNYELGLDFHLLLRKVFGSDNRKADFVIPRLSRSAKQNIAGFDTIIVYGKAGFALNRKTKKQTESEISRLFPFVENGKQYRHVSLYTSLNRENLRFMWNGYIPPEGRSWRYSTDRLDEFMQSGLIEQGNGVPSLKQFATKEDFITEIGTVWADIPRLLSSEKTHITFNQPVALLERVLQVSSCIGDIVVDPFCGSGTMAIACLKRGRHFIASDTSEEAFSIAKARIEDEDSTKGLVSFMDEGGLKNFPIIWNQYLLSNPTEEDYVSQLIEAGENSIVEFKESLVWNYDFKAKHQKPPDILKEIAAFMNTEGGTIILGVKDDKSLQDLTLDYNAANAQKNGRDGYDLYLTSKVKTGLKPIPASGYSIKFFVINDCEICVIKVKKVDRPTFASGKFYIRTNSQSTELNNEEFYDYLDSHFSK